MLETSFGRKRPLEFSEVVFSFQMEAALRSSMSNVHGNQDERIPPLGSMAVALSTMDQLGRAHPTGPQWKTGISRSCYPLLMNILLFCPLSFSNTAFKNPYSNAAPFKPGILSAIKRVIFFHFSETLYL